MKSPLNGILELYDHVCNRVHVYTGEIKLPRRLLNTWKFALISKLSEANTTQVEVSHVATLPSTAETT